MKKYSALIQSWQKFSSLVKYRCVDEMKMTESLSAELAKKVQIRGIATDKPKTLLDAPNHDSHGLKNHGKNETKKVRKTLPFRKVIKRDPYCRRFLVQLKYDGTGYHGWMKQRTNEGKYLRTVEGTLEERLRPVLGQMIKFFPSGRTDAGVSALGQVAIFSSMLSPSCFTNLTKEQRKCLPEKSVKFEIGKELVDLETLQDLFNHALPASVRILSICLVDNKFDVMKNLWKRYRYTLPGKSEDLSEFCEFLDQCDHTEKFRRSKPVGNVEFDIDAMNRAAKSIIGTKDFASFQSKGGRKTTTRTVFDCYVETIAVGTESRISIVVVGDGFLYNMVRIIAGTLCLVGRGRIPSDSVSEILASKNRQNAGPTAWARGLCLEHVEFDNAWSAKS